MNARDQACKHWRGTLLMEQRFVCPLCETLIADSATAHVDHVVPLSRGGTNARSNLQAVHARCNRRKMTSLESELDLPFPPPTVDEGRWRKPMRGTRNFGVKLTASQLDAFRAAAERDGRTVSAWVRHQAVEALRRKEG